MKYLPLLTWWLLGRPLLSKCTQWKVMLWCQTCPPWQVQCEQWTDLWEQKLRMGEVCYERKRCVTTPDCLEGKVTHTNLYFESLFQFFFPPNYINSLRKSRFKMLPTILQASAPSTVVNNGMITWGAMTSLYQMETVVCLLEGIFSKTNGNSSTLLLCMPTSLGYLYFFQSVGKKPQTVGKGRS